MPRAPRASAAAAAAATHTLLYPLTYLLPLLVCGRKPLDANHRQLDPPLLLRPVDETLDRFGDAGPLCRGILRLCVNQVKPGKGEGGAQGGR